MVLKRAEILSKIVFRNRYLIRRRMVVINCDRTDLTTIYGLRFAEKPFKSFKLFRFSFFFFHRLENSIDELI